MLLLRVSCLTSLFFSGHLSVQSRIMQKCRISFHLFLLEHNIRKSPPGLISRKEEPCALRRRMNVSHSNGFQIKKKQKRKQGPLCRHKIGDHISPNTWIWGYVENVMDLWYFKDLHQTIQFVMEWSQFVQSNSCNIAPISRSFFFIPKLHPSSLTDESPDSPHKSPYQRWHRPLFTASCETSQFQLPAQTLLDLPHV